MKKVQTNESRSGGHSVQSTQSSEVRCECHRLLARCQRDLIVLCCPRCKKQAVISVANACNQYEINVEFVSRIS